MLSLGRPVLQRLARPRSCHIHPLEDTGYFGLFLACWVMSGCSMRNYRVRFIEPKLALAVMKLPGRPDWSYEAEVSRLSRQQGGPITG